MVSSSLGECDVECDGTVLEHVKVALPVAIPVGFDLKGVRSFGKIQHHRRIADELAVDVDFRTCFGAQNRDRSRSAGLPLAGLRFGGLARRGILSLLRL